MKTTTNDSLALHTDLYEINMMKTYWDAGKADQQAVFEVYFRKNPFESGYAIFAGLERVIQYVQNLQFTDDDIAYLRETQNYPEDFRLLETTISMPQFVQWKKGKLPFQMNR